MRKFVENLHYNGTGRLPDFFTEKEIFLIFNQLKNCTDYWKKKGYAEWGQFFKARDFTLVATIYILGLRPNEGCSLKFSDVDFRHATIKIRGETNKVKKDRVIPLPKTLIKILKDYMQFPVRRFWRGSPYFFPSFENDHISPGTLKTIMREKILKPLGLWERPEKLGTVRTIYKLRHSRATHLLNKQLQETGNPDLYAIANILGHADLRSTQVYLHTDKQYREYLRSQMEI